LIPNVLRVIPRSKASFLGGVRRVSGRVCGFEGIGTNKLHWTFTILTIIFEEHDGKRQIKVKEKRGVN